MLPDGQSQESLSAASPAGDEWEGPWGSISAIAHSVEILCIQIETEPGKPQIHHYPYRTIGRWTWSMDQPESLDVRIGSMQVMISGSGLRRLADALNLGQLRLVRWSAPPLLQAGAIIIRSIRIEDLDNG